MNEQQDYVRVLEQLQEGMGGLRKAQEQGSDVLRRMIAESPGRDAVLAHLRGELGDQKAVLSDVRKEVAAMARTVTSTHDAFTDFLERYGRHQIVANARAELTQLTVIWKADYADRQRTRNLARGLVHELTAHAVKDGSMDTATIDACVGERWLSEPTYWLAPAAMAVAARYRGDDRQVSRATSYAFSRDQAKSKLFFALTWSRMGRLGEAAWWMDRYLGSLHRDELGPEFTVLLDAIANAELGHEALTYASETMARWFREDPAALRPGPASSRAQLKRWQPWLREFSATGPTNGFAALRELSGEGWDVIEESWKSATAASGAVRYLMEEFPVERPVYGRKGQYTDRALDHLIDQQEPDEARLQRRMAQLHELLDHEGSLEAAALVGDLGRGEETLDFVTLLERAVFAPEQLSLGPPGRRLALSCVWESVREATAAMALRSRTLMPASMVLTVDGWSCEVPTQGTGPLDTVQVSEELRAYQENRIRSHVDAVAPSWILTLGCGALAVLDSVLLLPFLDGAGFGLFLVLAVALACGALWGLIRVPVRRHSLREDGVRRQAESVRQLNDAVNQALGLSAEWRRGLASAAALETWSPLEQGESRA
ncbi:hypothetical protein ACIRD0_11675 [Streptomyces microflavus]|uniref:hypothetical protein n=2 Tax=Streptomyces microflavus TaxID=1919 RepID=UPI0022549097|nr:hypothetical protein [Streptomyces microflavus]MCX4650856.1 hypothetical protein [Streptomyces microflavus]